MFSVGPDSGFDLAECMVELLDLGEGGVGQGGEEGKGLVDGGGGGVVLGDERFEFVVLLLSDEDGFSECLSVSGLVLLEVLDLCLELASSGDE